MSASRTGAAHWALVGDFSISTSGRTCHCCPVSACSSGAKCNEPCGSSNSSSGKFTGAAGAPAERLAALIQLDADYTLDDWASPDLTAVAQSVSEARGDERLTRARALLGCLGRAWGRLAERSLVSAASAYQQWNRRGDTRAYWVWRCGDIQWLSDAGAVPRRALDLKVKTAGTVALYGDRCPDFVHESLVAPNRLEVLEALGAVGDLAARDLIARLREIKASNASMDVQDVEAGLVYRALADRIEGDYLPPGDISPDTLRNSFARDSGLVLVSGQWRRPIDLVSGPPILEPYRHFVPPFTDSDRLWRMLRIKRPTLSDFLQVTKQASHAGLPISSSDEVVLLETWREIARLLESGAQVQADIRKMLARQRLWTAQGWRSERPIYTVSSPTLQRVLGQQLPFWAPGGDASQFAALHRHLKVEQPRPEQFVSVAANSALDEEATDLFGLAVELLRDDLQRNEPMLASALCLPWEEMVDFEVHVAHGLEVRVDLPGRTAHAPIEARADRAGARLLVRRSEAAGSVDGGGYAVAELFDRGARRVAQAWAAAWEGARQGRTAKRIVLAEQRADDARRRKDERAK